MNRKVLASILVAGAVLAAAVVGVVTVRTVQAAAPAVTSSARLHHGGDEGGGYTSQDLATALGISIGDLNSAVQKANDAALTQAVQSGLITQTQADEIRSQGTAFPLGGRWLGWLEQNGIDYNSLLAKELGISVDQLTAAYTKAYDASIDRAVSEGRLTQDQADLLKARRALSSNTGFQNAMKTAFENAVKQAVTDGVITQAQADQILSNMTGNGMGFFGGMHGFGGFGGLHGFRGERGERFGNGTPFGTPSSPTPEATQSSPSTGL